MSELSFHPPSELAQQGAEDCPLVADLIDYAVGRAAPEARRRVESHLRDKNCGSCRGWIASVTRSQAALWPGREESGAPVADRAQTASTGQHDLFRELEQRLQALEE